MEADVVIAGSAPENYLRQRVRAGKLIFRYSERPLKQGLEPLKYFIRLIRWHRNNPVGKPIYLLCASAYAAADFAKFGLFRNKAYQWGYFPEAKCYDRLPQKEENSVLWVGRFLDWKHPDDALRAAAKLREDGYDFHLRMIGTGPMEQQLRNMVSQWGMEGNVSFLGSMKPEAVRAYMEKSSIFLFTSDRQEGWGAVLNEAMNSGCAVVASHAAGCVPYLVRDGGNGLVYRSGDVGMLREKLEYLLEHPQQRAQLGTAAYETITCLWNTETAAQRLVELSKGLLGTDGMPDFEKGPCCAVYKGEKGRP
jgi:glycosyltransferase involved in cell wall biosynthesis